MEITKFNNCLYILGYWKHQKNEVLTIVNNDNFDFERNYILDFDIEFNINLLNSQNTENKKSIAKYYIQKIFEIAGYFEHAHHIDYFKLDKKNMSEIEYYYQKIHDYFEDMLHYIERNCFINNIDFQLLLHELKIDNYFSVINLKITDDKPEPIEPEIQTNNEIKITLLNQLGVFDLLTKKGLTNNNIAELLEFITQSQIKKGSINKTLSLLHNEFGQDLNEKYKSQIAQILLAKKIKLNNN